MKTLFSYAMQFMMKKKQIYVDTRYTAETKRGLICFYLEITSFIQEHLGGFKVVRKGTDAGSCFTQVIGTSSGTHSQAMDSSTDTPFAAGAGAAALFAAAGALFAAAGTPSIGISSCINHYKITRLQLREL